MREYCLGNGDVLNIESDSGKRIEFEVTSQTRKTMFVRAITVTAKKTPLKSLKYIRQPTFKIDDVKRTLIYLQYRHTLFPAGAFSRLLAVVHISLLFFTSMPKVKTEKSSKTECLGTTAMNFYKLGNQGPFRKHVINFELFLITRHPSLRTVVLSYAPKNTRNFKD